MIVAAALITGALTWLCIRRRRQHNQSARSNTATAQELQSDLGTVGAGAGPGGWGRGPVESDGGLRPYGTDSGPHMSEMGDYAPSSTQVSSGGDPMRQRMSGYFNADAALYPGQGYGGYSDWTGERTATPDNAARSVGADGQVPHGPVEMGPGGKGAGQDGRQAGSSERGGELGGRLVSGGVSQTAANARQADLVRDSIAGVFELHGDPSVVGEGGNADTRAPQPLETPGSEFASELGTPSPMSHEELQQQQQQQRQQRQQRRIAK